MCYLSFMWLDVVDLNGFYRSQLGKVARHFIKQQVRQIWPDVAGQTIVGLGYATPYLKQFEKEADRTLAIMPAQQGVTHWPREKANRVALSDEAALPFDDYSVDRLLLVHALENAEHVQQMMREAWRVLAGNGRMLIVAPSRRGLWARRDISPFGMGKPYSVQQLKLLLKETQFDPQQEARALYMPPSHSGILLHSAPVWERMGRQWLPRMGGVVMVEARKQIYAATPARRVAKRRLVVVPSAIRENGSGS
ncbi:class I SAM-dependent methyltransferase [Curvivirga sp.]|uniref:class I SAM-dependent methyltransferase n=1 Tax=Curvivirga sp. TaxID=2856848 RepID=UPI003B5AC708